jgi:hypothetical protein
VNSIGEREWDLCLGQLAPAAASVVIAAALLLARIYLPALVFTAAATGFYAIALQSASMAASKRIRALSGSWYNPALFVTGLLALRTNHRREVGAPVGLGTGWPRLALVASPFLIVVGVIAGASVSLRRGPSTATGLGPALAVRSAAPEVTGGPVPPPTLLPAESQAVAAGPPSSMIPPTAVWERRESPALNELRLISVRGARGAKLADVRVIDEGGHRSLVGVQSFDPSHPVKIRRGGGGRDATLTVTAAGYQSQEVALLQLPPDAVVSLVPDSAVAAARSAPSTAPSPAIDLGY